MRVYIQSKRGTPLDVNSYAAYQGFNDMGFETRFYEEISELTSLNYEDIVVGGIGAVRGRLAMLGLDRDELNYPSELQEYLGRRVWASTLHTVCDSPDVWPLFIKPREAKLFTGGVIQSFGDLARRVPLGEDIPIFCSEVISLVSEYRVFVRYGKILDVRRYNGDWSIAPNRAVIMAALNDFTQAPSAYSMDFGVTEAGETILVEVNDGHSLGTYGLIPALYAQMISARWAQIIGIEDPCDFTGEGRLWLLDYPHSGVSRIGE